MAQLSDCLRADFQSTGETFGVRSVVSEHVYFILGDNGGASCILRYENDVLIVLDRNVILQAFLFSYFMTLPDSYARIVAAVLLVLGGHRAHGPIPFQEQLANFAATRNRTLAYQTLNDVVDFIALHELGHIAEQPPESLLHVIIHDSKSAIEIDRLIYEDIRQFGNPGNERLPRHRCFGTYRLFETCHQGFSTLRRSIDDPWSLYIDHEKSRKLGEFASDMFAVYARSILDSSGGFHSLVLDQLPFRVLVINHLFFYLATINPH
jgi:hypothetical protein